MEGEGVNEQERVLLKVKDVQGVLQLGRDATYRLIQSGQIPHVRFGRSIRVPKFALVDYIKAKLEAEREKMNAAGGA